LEYHKADMDASDLIDPRKRAALALVGLHEADRKWLLAQLPEGERDGVVALLGELERMNLPAAAAQIVAAADVWALDRPEPEPASASDEPLDVVSHASAVEIYRELRDASDGVIARVLVMKNWRWRTELASLLGEARAADIARLQHEVPLPDGAVGQALIAALAARITAGDRDADFEAALREARKEHEPKNGRWWSRWLR
jgi:hypothetical protein